ncbi:Uncharacterised protein [Escherichia coli]|nr:Uncharacterised protein [Escherichia coli]
MRREGGLSDLRSYMPRGKPTILNSTQYHQQCQHLRPHRCSWMPHTSADNRSRLTADLYLQSGKGQPGCSSLSSADSRFSNQAIPRNGLTNTLSYSQSKPQALYHQVPSRRPGALVGDGGHQSTFTSHSQAASRMPTTATYAEVISRVNMLPCASSVVCGSTPCSGGTISAPTKVERISSTISGRL